MTQIAGDTALDAEVVAVTAHWLLNRLSIVQATLARVDRSGEIGDPTTDLLLSRSRAAVSDIQATLEDLSRGVPPLFAELHD